MRPTWSWLPAQYVRCSVAAASKFSAPHRAFAAAMGSSQLGASPFQIFAHFLREEVARPHSSRQIRGANLMLIVTAQPLQNSLHHLRSIQPPQKQKRHGMVSWKADMGWSWLAALSRFTIAAIRSFIDVDERSSRPSDGLRLATTILTSSPASSKSDMRSSSLEASSFTK